MIVRETGDLEGGAERPMRRYEGSRAEPGEWRGGRSRLPGLVEEPSPATENLMEQVVESQNLRTAYWRVKGNAGAPGIDKMTVEELSGHLNERWAEIKGQLLDGTYRPQPVRRVEIPKPDGGKRKLGVPTVLDRVQDVETWAKEYKRLKHLIRSVTNASLGELRNHVRARRARKAAPRS